MKNSLSRTALVFSLALAFLTGSIPPMQPSQASTTGSVRQEALAAQAYAQLPLYFIANQGQRDESIAYYAQGGRHSIAFTAREVAISLGETTLQARFVGARATQPVGAERKATRVNYLIGSDPARWQTDIPTYNKVIYDDLYPGIDLYYEGQTGTLKYTLVVAPGADVAQFRLAYAGADGLWLEETGDLLISAGGDVLRDTELYAYQEIGGQRLEVDVAFALRDAYSIGFAVTGGYDPRYPLVIDPSLEYGTYLGGSDTDMVLDIAVDGSGSIYIVGGTHSTDFPTRNAYQGDQLYGDAFVAKIDPTQNGDASLVYATYLGGSGAEAVNDIAVDDAGNVYLTGVTMSADFPVENEFQSGRDIVTMAFISKLDAAGNELLYSTCLGFRSGVVKGSGGESIATDGNGHAYVTGFTAYDNLLVTQNAYQQAYGGGPGDAFVAKIDTNQVGIDSLLYSSYLGGSGNEWGYAIAADAGGNVYLTGKTLSSDFPSKNAYQPAQAQAGTHDAFVTKIDTTQSGDASLVYSTYLGGDRDDHGYGLALDESGNAYVTGYTESSDFPTQNNYQGDQPAMDAYVTKLNPAGNALVYSTYLGGNYSDWGQDITLDDAANAYVTGYTQSTDFPTQNRYQGDQPATDAFVTKLNTSGDALVYSTYLGGSDDDYGQGIAVNGSGYTFVAGYTESSDFPTQNGYQGDQSATDGFVIVLDKSRPDLSTSSKQVSPTVIEPTGTLRHPLSYTITLVNTGNLTATASLTDSLSISLTLTSGPTCSGGACGYNAGDHTITWTGSLTPAAAVTITYAGQVSVPIGTGDTICFVNTALVDDGASAPFTLTARSVVNPHYIYLPLVLRPFAP
jgi:uncharacterized repeat protein (TIGR01451 family)